MRALRRRRAWRQVDLAAAAGVSQSTITRLERGLGDRLTVRALDVIAGALGARVSVRLDYNGEALDRLLDEDHAELVDAIVRRLLGAGWTTRTEVTFSIAGERGAIDVLAWHQASGAVLVVEAKSVVPDIQATLGTLDRKVRLAWRISRDIGWVPSTVGCLLVVVESRTSRRRVDRVAATFDAALPDRAIAVRRWVAKPDPGRALRGLLFLALSRQPTARHRVSTRGRPSRAGVAAERSAPTGPWARGGPSVNDPSTKSRDMTR